MVEIKIHTPYVTLGQFLKLADLISSGGEAKPYLQEHEIYVNEELDNRRGRKLYPEMVIQTEGKKFIIKASEY